MHERAREFVGEDAAHGVGVADVHVAGRSRGDQELSPVDQAVGADVSELGRLADATDAPARDEDRAVSDDPALPVEGQDVTSIVDLEVLLSYGVALRRVTYRVTSGCGAA